MKSQPVIVQGVLGWGNPTSGEMNHSLDTYGPLGRWHNEGRTQGHRLADALVEAGMSEGARLVVVSAPRPCTDEMYEELVRRIESALADPEEGR